MSRSTEPDRLRRRAWLIALGAVLVALLIGIVVLRQFTNPAFLEKTISAAMGPDYQVDVGSSSFNLLARRFVANQISIQPDTASQDVRDGMLRKRYSLAASTVRVDGINLWALSKRCFSAASVEIDTPRVEIYRDRKVPGATEPESATLPHQMVKAVDCPFRIDTVRISGGDLRYSERAEDGSRPGTFRFADLNAEIGNITNDAKRMRIPCTIEVRTRLADVGQLDASFDYDLQSEALTMNYRGTVGTMGALSLNELLVDLEGVRITSGVIDSTSFAFEVKDDVATGNLRVLFHDIAFEMIDKNSQEQGLAEHFGTLVYRSKSRESNPEGDDPPIEVTIERRREPQVSLIRFVWETVREGLLRSLGVQ